MGYTYSGGTITQNNTNLETISSISSAGINLLDLSVGSSSAFSVDYLASVSGTTSYNGQYLINSIPNGTTIRIPDTDIHGTQNAFGSTETGSVTLGDNSLSGLAGLTGVTSGTLAQQSTYDINSSTLLVINGDVAYDGQIELLILNGIASNYAIVNGTLTIGRIRGVNSDNSSRYSKGVSFVTAVDGGSVNREVLSPSNGAVITFYGGEILLASGIGVQNGSTGLMTFYETTLTNISPTTFTHLGRSESENSISYYNCTFDGRDLNGNIFSLNGTNQLSGKFLNASLQNRFGTHNNAAIYSNLTFATNYAPQDWVIFGDSSNDNAQAIEITNVDIGTGIRTGFDTANREGHLAIFQEIDVRIRDSNAVNVESAKIYISTTDNGNRVNSVRSDATGKFQNNRTFTTGAFDVYEATTDSGGQTGTITILTGRIWSDDGAETIEYDLYSNTNVSGTDDYTFKYCSYNHNLKNSEFILKNEEKLTPIDILIVDAKITETTKTSADSYTSLNDAYQVYDRAKSYLYDIFKGETELIVDRTGSVLEINSYNMIIDGSATSAFSFSSPDITIKSLNFVGGISTSGYTLIQNNADLTNGTYTSTIKIPETGRTLTNIIAPKVEFISSAGSYSLNLSGSNCDITEIEVTSGANLTVNLIDSPSVPTKTETSGTITYIQNVNVTAPNILDNSRVQLYNTTKSIELDNSVVSGGGGYSFSVDIQTTSADVNDEMKLSIAYQNGTSAKELLLLEGTLTSTGLNFNTSQTDQPIYNSYGVDGSTITEFSWDNPNLTIDISDPDNSTVIQRVGAWYYYYLTTADGIRNLSNCLDWETINQIKVKTETCNLKITNENASALLLNGGRLYRDDDVTIISSGSNSIQIDYNPIYDIDVTNITNKLTNIESGYDHDDLMKLMSSVLLGKTSGAPNATAFRDVNDTKNRVTSVTDNDGNRTTVNLDET